MTTLARLLDEVGAAPEGPEVAAFFDVDGTLVAGYTAKPFYDHRMRRGQVGVRELARSLVVFADSAVLGGNPGRLGPVAIAGLRGKTVEELDELGEALFREQIASSVRPEMRELLEAHRRRGHTIALASSATHFQVDPLARELGVEHVLCSEVSVADGRLTGTFEGGMLWGEAKAAAARAFAREHGADAGQSFAYANGDEDIALLASFGNPRPIRPDPLLRRAARQEGWPVLDLHSVDSGAGVREFAGTAAAAGGMNLSLAIGAGAGLLTQNRRTGANVASRFAFDLALGLAGVRLEVVGAENLWSARPAVFVFNHQSNLDPMVAAALIRRDFTSTGKQEAKRDPMAALAGYVLDAVFLDRDDPEHAKEQLSEAVERLRDGVSVMIAPEGTRSRGAEPGPYKHGGFHLAMQAGVPIVPLVLRDTGERMPRGSKLIRTGTVHVRVLEPIPTDGWTADDVSICAAELRDRTAALITGDEEWEAA